MSGFSETFTKNEEELLNYDDGAAYYFAATILTCVKNHSDYFRDESARFLPLGAGAGGMSRRTISQ